MRRLRIACGGEIATCKTCDLYRKMAQFETFIDAASQKEKKIGRRVLEFISIFSRHNLCFSFWCADNLLPRDQRVSPKQGRAT